MSAPTRCPAIQPGTNAACCIAVHGPDTPHAWDDGDAWPGYAEPEYCPRHNTRLLNEFRYCPFCKTEGRPTPPRDANDAR